MFYSRCQDALQRKRNEKAKEEQKKAEKRLAEAATRGVL